VFKEALRERKRVLAMRFTMARRSCAPRRLELSVAGLPVGARGWSLGALCGLALAGCACEELAEMRARQAFDQALLVAPQKPECGEATARLRPTTPATDQDANLALRIRLEYERECYRHAELAVRKRLKKLQSAARAATKPRAATEQRKAEMREAQ
jgi:hypothetical protein